MAYNHILSMLQELQKESRPAEVVRICTPKYLRHILLDIRVRIGLSREVVADLSGIHVNSIENWEIGKFQPRLHDMEAWSNSVGYDVYLTLVPRVIQGK